MFCLHVCVPHACLGGQKRVLDPFGTGVSDSCGPSCGCWELNRGPLEGQSVLRSVELSLQLLCIMFWGEVSNWTWSSYIWSGSLANELQGSTAPAQWHWESSRPPSRPGFKMGSGPLNSGPCACVASNLPTKPSLQPQVLSSWGVPGVIWMWMVE